MAKDRLLITGSSGTIGKMLAERLSDLFELIGVDVVREELVPFASEEESDSKGRMECKL